MHVDELVKYELFPVARTYIEQSSRRLSNLMNPVTRIQKTLISVQYKAFFLIRGATALTNLGRLSSRRWQSFLTAPDGTGLTCGQHIESHSCIFSFLNRTVTSLFK
jgi:hypothetical protein